MPSHSNEMHRVSEKNASWPMHMTQQGGTVSLEKKVAFHDDQQGVKKEKKVQFPSFQLKQFSIFLWYQIAAAAASLTMTITALWNNNQQEDRDYDLSWLLQRFLNEFDGFPFPIHQCTLLLSESRRFFIFLMDDWTISISSSQSSLLACLCKCFFLDTRASKSDRIAFFYPPHASPTYWLSFVGIGVSNHSCVSGIDPADF